MMMIMMLAFELDYHPPGGAGPPGPPGPHLSIGPHILGFLTLLEGAMRERTLKTDPSPMLIDRPVRKTESL